MTDEEKIKAALDRYMKNETWKEYYENAPSENCKKHIALTFWDSYERIYGNAEDAIKTHIKSLKDEAETQLDRSDWGYLYKHSANNPFKLKCKKKMEGLL